MKYLQKVVELPQELEEHIIYFNETDGKICVKPIFSFIRNIYNITNVETSTRLTNIKPLKMIVDGETIDGSLEYQFDTVGEHTVELYYDPNITDLSSMFGWSDDIGEQSRCLNLVSSDLTNFKCSKAISANHMYAHARNMKSIIGLDIAFKDNIIQDWGWFLNECSGLTGTLNVTNLVTENTTNCPDIMSWTSISELNGFDTWNMSNVSKSSHMFYRCSKLKQLTMSNTVTKIDNNTFDTCSSLSSITLPNTLTSIGNNAFYGCSSLSSITLPNTLTSIGGSAFHSCSSLTSVTIPSSITMWKQWEGNYNRTFAGCSSLQSVYFEDGQEYLAGQMFRGTWYYNNPPTPEENKSVVSLPTSIKYVGPSPFFFCSLPEITFRGTIEQFNENVLSQNTSWSRCSGYEAKYSIDIVHCIDGDLKYDSATSKFVIQNA